jgi:outer membrane protein assembly factor BamB
VACAKESSEPDPVPPPTPEPSGIAMMSEFIIKTSTGASFAPGEVITEVGTDSIKILVPAFTDITKLTTNGSFTGVAISPALGTASTVDFSSPVTYTITAENGNKKSYVVVIKKDKIKNVLFVGFGDSFGAINALTGAYIWKYFATGGFAYSSPTISNGMVYAGCINSKMYAFDVLTGVVKWSYETGPTGIECPPAVANGIIYFGSNDDNFYALDAATGAFKWKYATGGNVSSSPVVKEGTVYFGSSDNNVYALDAVTGAFKWQFTTGGMINQSGIAYSNGVIFFGSRDGYLYAVDAITGTQKWRFSSGGISFESSTPLVANGLVYMPSWYGNNASIKGSFYAIDEATGTQVWKALDNLGFSANPFLANGIVYISADGGIFYALNAATGATLWMQNILPNAAGAVAADGVVYVGGGGTHNYYAFDAVAGSVKWMSPLNNSLSTSDPCMFDGKGNVVGGR